MGNLVFTLGLKMLDVLGILPHTHTHLVCASHARAHLPSQVPTEELFEMLNALYTHICMLHISSNVI